MLPFDFDRQRAEEDQYFLYMAICIIVIAISVFPLYMHLGGAFKYLALRVGGELTVGKVMSIENRNVSPKRKTSLLFKNSKAPGNFYDVSIRFQTSNDATQTRKLVLARLSGKMLRREPIELVYFSINPNIFLPANMMPVLRTDVAVAGVLALAFCSGFAGLIFVYVRRQRFLVNQSRYGKIE